jgi:hypothetical protein
MSSEDFEIAEYCQGLLDHESGCESAGCPTCAALGSIFGLIRERLFSSVVYGYRGSPIMESPGSIQSELPSTRRRTHSVR